MLHHHQRYSSGILYDQLATTSYPLRLMVIIKITLVANMCMRRQTHKVFILPIGIDVACVVIFLTFVGVNWRLKNSVTNRTALELMVVLILQAMWCTSLTQRLVLSSLPNYTLRL